MRLTQGKETAHFKLVFRNKMVIFRTSAVFTSATALFHVKGRAAVTPVAGEVTATAAMLNSSAVFIAVSTTQAFVWKGKYSSAAERAAADGIARYLASVMDGNGSKDRKVVFIEEGAESEAFWSVLGGRKTYTSLKQGASVASGDPRLFEASSITGRFAVTEVTRFSQSDLAVSNAYLLDVQTHVFVWTSDQTSQATKTKALATAKRFEEVITSSSYMFCQY